MLLKTWQHTDGRRIEVYADYKIRKNFSVRDRGIGSPSRDEWPVLWRADVPNLTDNEWIAMPIEEGWKEI